MPDNHKVIVSSSFGKDSTAMLHLMLEHGEQIDEVMYFETGWDFPQMEEHIRQVEKNTEIKTIRIRHYRHFNELLGRWGWPHKRGGWCTARKITECNKLFRGLNGTIECIGYSTGERFRARKIIQKKKWLVWFPLIEYGFSESDALSYCKSLGYTWGGLYEVFNRVSCFCCPKAGPKRIDQLKVNFPDLYARYLEMDEIANGEILRPKEKREG
jgi:3'-phosphoadenosine 5'-phosphosulfate sulfotransferase (PAPS reductase)/FAD synthetase